MLTSLKRLPAFWALQIGGWMVYGMSRFTFWYPFYKSILHALASFLFVTFIGFALSLILRSIYKWLRSRHFSYLTVSSVGLSSSIAFGILWFLSVVLFQSLLDPKRGIGKVSWHDYAFGFFDHSFTLVTWSALYFGIKYWQDFQAQKEQTLKANALAHQAQLQMLRYQINPHFLFNSLNSIRALIDEDYKRAKNMVTELSGFLRYSLVGDKENRVLLKEELQAVRNYLDIEKIRFEDRLEVKFDIEPEAMEISLPCFLIHPLVENAIKHGMQTSPQPLKLRLQTGLSNGWLKVSVANTGRLLCAKEDSSINSNGTGTGLQNVRQRLMHLFPDSHRFNIAERAGWVEAVIEILLEKSDERAIHSTHC